MRTLRRRKGNEKKRSKPFHLTATLEIAQRKYQHGLQDRRLDNIGVRKRNQKIEDCAQG